MEWIRVSENRLAALFVEQQEQCHLKIVQSV